MSFKGKPKAAVSSSGLIADVFLHIARHSMWEVVESLLIHLCHNVLITVQMTLRFSHIRSCWRGKM